MNFFSKVIKKKNGRHEISESYNQNNLQNDVEHIRPMSDSPITCLKHDTIGRAPLAHSFVRHISTLDARGGIVIGILGAWGSGKTSFINLARDEFRKEDITVLDFNPWMFSGTEQLVQSFFVEITAQLKLQSGLSKVGEELEAYGELFSEIEWIPLIGPWIKRGNSALKTINDILQRRKVGVNNQRTKIEKALIKIDKKIVVIIDDIDRLSTEEIRDVFKLVRLTANFPNIVYIVAFDRIRVETALSEQGIPGRDYLEKILQTVIDLPPIPNQVLSGQILKEIDNALKGIDKIGPFREEVWPDVFMEIVRPLIRNMRDVRRYAVGIRGTVISLNGEVELTDVLSLEAIRIFLPDVFIFLPEIIEALTTTSDYHNSEHESKKLKAKVEELISISGDYSDVIRRMIHRLFPAALQYINNTSYGNEWKREWLNEHRVAHEDILHFYLERFTSINLNAFFKAEYAWNLFSNRDLLDLYLRSIDPKELEDVIASFENYEDKYEKQHVMPVVTVLLNLLPDIPKRQRGMFELDASLVVSRVVLRLLRVLKEPEPIESAVRCILPEIKLLSSKLELISLIGHVEGVGHSLVSEDSAKQFEYEWLNAVKFASIEELLIENNIFTVLLYAKKINEELGEPFSLPNDPNLTLAILKAARSEMLSQTIGNRAVSREERLDWNNLLWLYGSEVPLKNSIDNLKSSGLEGNENLLILVNRYMTNSSQ